MKKSVKFKTRMLPSSRWHRKAEFLGFASQPFSVRQHKLCKKVSYAHLADLIGTVTLPLPGGQMLYVITLNVNFLHNGKKKVRNSNFVRLKVALTTAYFDILPPGRTIVNVNYLWRICACSYIVLYGKPLLSCFLHISQCYYFLLSC